MNMRAGMDKEDIAAVDLELERLNADKADAAAQKALVNKPKRPTAT